MEPGYVLSPVERHHTKLKTWYYGGADAALTVEVEMGFYTKANLY